MPSLSKLPLLTKDLVLPARILQDYFELCSSFTYRTTAASYPGNNAYESTHLGAVQAVFRKQAEKLEQSKVNKKENIDWFIEKLPLTPDSSVLDLNCGTGLVSRAIAPNVKKVVGTDISRHLIKYANSKPINNASFERAEAATLPFEDSSFDVVFSRLSFNHFLHRVEVLREIKRVCKPGGHIALLERVIPDELDAGTTVRMEFIEGIRDPSHTFFVTPPEMKELFTEENIDITTKETTTCAEPFEDYLLQTNVSPDIHTLISELVYANMIAPNFDYEQTTGFYPHLVDDVITLTHHMALIGGTNPVEKPQKKE